MLVGLHETKRAKLDYCIIRQFGGNKDCDWCKILVEGLSGGLSILWDPSRVEIGT